MAKFIIVLCALVACAAAKPGVVAPLAYSAPIATAYSAYGAAIAAPLPYVNAHLNAATSSSRLDINQRYGAAVVPAHLAAAHVAAPLVHAAPHGAIAAPLAHAAPLVHAAPHAAIAAPVTVAAPWPYVNGHLDAASASSRLDVNQRYSAAVLPAHLHAAHVAAPLVHAAPAAAHVAAPLVHAAPHAAHVGAPLVHAAPHAAIAAPLSYVNAHLDAASASSRLDVYQRYSAAVLPAAYAGAPLAAAVAPIKYTAAPGLW